MLLPHALPAAAATIVTAILAVTAVVTLTSMGPTTLDQRLGSLPQFQVESSAGQRQMQQLPQYGVGGSLDFPAKAAGMDMPKSASQMGQFQVTNEEGTNLGDVGVKQLPAAKGPDPTIVRYGDVGVQPAGCPNCPVLDTKAVELQKEKVRANEERIRRLKELEQKNYEEMVKSIDNMKVLKSVLADSLFDMKEAVKKEEMDVEANMKKAQTSPGPPGEKGPPGYDGLDGVAGEDGPNGLQGRMGDEGKPGMVGPTGNRGPQGPQGGPGPVGKDGKQGELGPQGARGPRGKIGSSSATLRCSRIGGIVFKEICFKSSQLTRNRDKVPSDCKPWQPDKKWNEGDWWALASMFKTKVKISSDIDREVDGGRCDNHQAVMSFSQDSDFSKVWVNKKTFSFNPTSQGETCNLHNDDDTVAVYACAI